MPDTFCIVLTTTNSKSNKQALIHAVLGEQLAACIQSMPIESHYVWQDEVCIDEEWLLVMKTTQRCYRALETLIVEEHDYDTPQVVKLPFTEGFNPYLAWLDENTRR